MLTIPDNLKSFRDTVSSGIGNMNSTLTTLSGNLEKLSTACTTAQNGFSSAYNSANKSAILTNFTSLTSIISKISSSLNGDMKVGNTVKLKIDFNRDYEGTVRIALPNALRLSQKKKDINENSKYFVQNNMIDYITIYKTKKCKSINLSLAVINPGNYKFENIVCNVEGKHHISNSLNLNFK